MPIHFTALILDTQERSLPSSLRRHLKIEVLPGKATVCVGVRRCGKSTLMVQQMQRLLDSDVPRQNIVHLNFFDDRLHGLTGAGLDAVTEAYYGLFPQKKGREKVYFFFDEIQVVPGWEPFVDRLLRTELCEVYITGSSARMLSREVATQMRGRALSWELFPFSFAEFLDHEQVAWGPALSTRQRLLVVQAFGDFWERGGFPEVAALPNHLRVRVHQEYFRSVLYRDLVERHDISHPQALLALAHRLLDNVGSLYSVNKLTHFLHSLGHGVPKASVSDYLEWLEDACFLFTVTLFDASLARRRTNPKKIYCVDHALVRSVSASVLVNSGHLLENLVFTVLRRQHEEVYYFKSHKGFEVDFVVPRAGQPPLLVQVCESLVAPATRRRELRALRAAMDELGVTQGTVVTREESGEDEGLRIVPAWRFALELG